LNFSEIRKDIVNWARTYSGINEIGRHIWLNQTAPQPNAPYITLNIISGPTKIGTTDSMIFNQMTGKFEVTGVRIFTLDVNVYGENSIQIATDLSLSIESPDVQSFFRQANITPGGSSPSVRNMSEILDTIIESRSMFELIFMASYTIGTETTFIESVEAEGIDGINIKEFLIDTV